MEKLVIQGGNKLEGRVKVSGSKNAALPILFATVLNGGKSEIRNLPDLWDISSACKLLRTIGATVERNREQDTAVIDTEEVNHLEAPYDLVKTMRASVLVLGPMLARFHQAKVSMPGGCAIGARPVDQHLKGLEALGAEIKLEHGYIKARASRLRGARIVFDMPTVGGTENLMMAASLADGITVLQNCAREPEIVDLAGFLNAMGAKITGAGNSDIIIEGVHELSTVTYDVIPDRVVAGTLIVAAAMTGGDVVVESVRVDHMRAVIDKITEAGVLVEEVNGGDALRVRRPSSLKAVNIKTQAYPGFPTDMQAQIMALLTLAEGQTVIKETVFENRFMHVNELVRLGADVRLEGNTAFVKGVKSLQGATVMATDLRASASLVLAGLVSEGVTEVNRIYHLDRGYERLEEKLNALGADIRREPMETSH